MARDVNSERLQIMLTALGYNTYGIDGILGRNSQKAILSFQQDYELEETGTATQETVDTAYSEFMNNDIDANGLVIQALVRNAGYNPGTLDGVVGRNTRAAVADFQRDNGLEDSGDVDDDTLEALKNALYGAC